MAILNAPVMKRSSTAFLQMVIVLIGIAAVTFLLWEPHVEGVNQNKKGLEVYYNDPFLMYVYVGSIPFFIALYKGFRVLGYAGHDGVFTQNSISALRVIKRCGFSIIGFVFGGEVYLFTCISDDRAGGVAMGLIFSFGSVFIIAAAATFEAVLMKAMEIKSENDLTV